MSYKNCLRFLILTLLALILDARMTNACSCVQISTVLEAYEWAKVIVIAQAISVEKSEQGVDGISSTKMVVEKVFKGNLMVGDEMIFAQGGGGDCIWTFSEKSISRQFLFYLSTQEEKPKLWYAGFCSRSRPLEGAADDLLYLENLAKVRGRTRLSGTLVYFDQSSRPEDGEGDFKFLDGRKVRIIGENQTYEVVTNASGVYEIYDLPAGKYTVEPEVPEGWKIDFPSSKSAVDDVDRRERQSNLTKQPFQIMLATGKHAYFNFVYKVKNVIRGKVFDNAGNEMENVCLELIPAQGKAAGHFYKTDCTKKDGRFEIESVPPGRYLIVINGDGKLSSNEPFPTFYYPNVVEREKAGVITIGAGETREGIIIYAPKAEETIKIEGVCKHSDGKPVVEGWVEFKADQLREGIDDGARAKTDSTGRFVIKVLKGLKGKLYSKMYVYPGKFENCPQIETLIKNNAGKSGETTTNIIEIQASENISNVELKYPFPYCKRKEF